MLPWFRMVWLGSFLFWLLCIGQQAQAQSPGWLGPNPSSYAYTASAVIVLNHDEIRSDNLGDTIAFFVGSEIRGLGFPIDVPGIGVFHFVTLYSNQGQEEMTAQVYYAAENQSYASIENFLFKAHNISGSIDSPYTIFTFLDGDAPISLLPFPNRTGISGIPLPPIDLNDYLVQLDGDDVVWDYVPSPDFDVQLQGSIMTLIPMQNFTGTINLMLTATEQTLNEKSASGTMTCTIGSPPDPPLWSSLPGEGILLNEEFTPFQLNDFMIPPVPGCTSFDYFPEITVADPPIPDPSWQFSGFYRNNMTVLARPVFTSRYAFNDPGDRLAVFANGQIKGVASPTFISGKVYYYLSVAGGSIAEPLTILFYSAYMNKIFTLSQTLTYLPYKSIGTFDQPLLLDFSPLTPILSEDGNVEILINDTTWTGSQVFHFLSSDCLYPAYFSDTTSATFCIQSDASGYTTLYRDFDGDGFGDPAYAVSVCDGNLIGWVSNSDDCFDSPANVPCPYFASLDVPIPIDYDYPDTIESHINVSDLGFITSIKVNNLRINHTYLGDLRITLVSPALTEVVLFDQRCGGDQNLLLDLDSESSHPYNEIPCPPNGGQCYQPLEDLSILNGENINGNWTLIVEDLANGDGGSLQSWGLQICYQSCDVLGEENTYTGTSGSWDEVQRWSLGHLPTECEHAIIDLDEINDVVQVSLNDRIDIYRLTVMRGVLVLPNSSTIQVKQ